jgi:hypothetical protein
MVAKTICTMTVSAAVGLKFGSSYILVSYWVALAMSDRLKVEKLTSVIKVG